MSAAGCCGAVAASARGFVVPKDPLKFSTHPGHGVDCVFGYSSRILVEYFYLEWTLLIDYIRSYIEISLLD